MFLCMNTVVLRIVITSLVCNFINNSHSLLIVNDLAWYNLGIYVYFGVTKIHKKYLLTNQFNCVFRSKPLLIVHGNQREVKAQLQPHPNVKLSPVSLMFVQLLVLRYVQKCIQ